MRSRGRRRAVAGIEVLVLAADQVSKYLVLSAGPAAAEAAWSQSA